MSDLVPGTGKVTLSVTPGAGLDVTGILLALDRYPYGCAEQITSRALPLLYVNAIAERLDLDDDTAITKRVRSAIERLLAMQSSSGGFGRSSRGKRSTTANCALYSSSMETTRSTRCRDSRGC